MGCARGRSFRLLFLIIAPGRVWQAKLPDVKYVFEVGLASALRKLPTRYVPLNEPEEMKNRHVYVSRQQLSLAGNMFCLLLS